MLFQKLLAACGCAPLEAQACFHRHRWSARPEISVLMSRADARTVSRTQIDILAGRSKMRADCGLSMTEALIAMEYRELADTGATPC
jgi:hypothetical protein